MTTKNLAIREDVYRKLAEAKSEGESFSDVIERLLERHGSLLPLWGALKDSEEIGGIEREVREIRKRAVIRAR
ncbi:MAG TPA: antitoxin VapB family protein [Nitrososphaerales archaeon]